MARRPVQTGNPSVLIHGQHAVNHIAQHIFHKIPLAHDFLIQSGIFYYAGSLVGQHLQGTDILFANFLLTAQFIGA